MNSQFNFRAYHVRSINASSEEEKEQINAELKALYEGLDESQKAIFNKELQAFLMGQYKNLSDDVEAIKNSGVNLN